MSQKAATFVPHWHSSPARTIRDAIDVRGLSVSQFAAQLDWDNQRTFDLLSGKERIDERVAGDLSSTLGGSRAFWLKRQNDFDNDLKFCASMVPSADAENFVQQFPTSDMRRHGWLPKRTSKLEAYLQYFDVSSPSEWNEKYSSVRRQVF